tara:strand:+ start:14545 stop:15261 length:717 start_codon:yes stop_codon:yes gene_type:complete
MKSIKTLLLLVLVASITSCHFDLGHENGNGNVTTQERAVNQDFDKVRGSSGIDIYLTEGSENKIVVEADENLIDLIETIVTNGKLIIRSSKNIGRSKAKKVHVTFIKLSSIEASSGADIIGKSVIKNETINLDCSSGADLEVEVFAKELYAETSSGADLDVSGKASAMYANASSGSELNAKNLNTITCNAKASSGADIIVTVQDKINAKASSGGDIRYYGDPVSVTKKDGKTGNIRKM